MIIPFLISSILAYFDGRIDLQRALIYASILCLCTTLNAIIHHPYFLRVILLGMKIRIACSGIIYKKLFKLNYSSDENKKIGGKKIKFLFN